MSVYGDGFTLPEHVANNRILMVTDIQSFYSSPAGKEYTVAAGRFSLLTPASRVLDIGCGYGEGATMLAQEFRCQVTAIDIIKENIEFARSLSVKKGVSHLVSFDVQDILSADYAQKPFDLICAEGGILSYISRQKGLSLMSSWLLPRGWIAFSDLIFVASKVPEQIKKLFDDSKYHYETEESYRKLVSDAGFDVQLATLVPKSGWDTYYAHMARRLDDDKGFFADKRIKLAFHKEIDVFYRVEAFKYVGYLVCIARKK